MKAIFTLQDHKASIVLEGSFTYEAHREFKNATTSALTCEGLTEIEVDFAGVDYLDSAALGMLLLFNERASGRKISLINCQGTVRAVLEIANFNKVFEIR